MALRSNALVVRIACVLLGAAAGCSQGAPPAGSASTEIVVIRLPERLGALERPVVAYDHGRHAKALDDKCETCHPEVKPGDLSQKLGRVEDGNDRDALVDLYHAQCRGCHAARAKAKLSTGPLMCGECHVRRPETVAARR